PDQVANGTIAYEDFQSRAAAFGITALEQVLSNDAAQTCRERVANLVLFFRWKYFDNTVNSLCGVGGVQCAENQVTCRGSFNCQSNRFQIAHFTDEDDIRVFTQCTF